MFDGIALPTLRSTAPSRLEIEPLHPINRGLRLWLPLTHYVRAYDGAETWDISPFRRRAVFVNPRAGVMTALGRAYSAVNPNELLTIGPRDLSTGSDLGLGGRTGGMAAAGWVYLGSTSLTGLFFKLGNQYDGFGIGVGSTTADSAGNNLIGLYANIRWLASGVAIGTGWHHVGISLNGSGHPTLYLDGRAVYSDTTGAPAAVGSGSAPFTTFNTEIGTGRYSTAYYQNWRVWGRSLSVRDMAQLADTRWIGAASPEERIFIGWAPPAASSSITGTSDVTLGAFTGAFTGSLTIRGASDVTLGAMAGAFTGSLTNNGASDVTLGAFTGAFTGSLTIRGASAVTLPPFTGAFTGSLTIRGASAVTLGAFTGAFTATTGSTYPWSNTTLSHTDVVFGGGAATFTDPAPGTGPSFGQFGQRVTIPAGKWRVRASVALTAGASNGLYGAPYFSIGFFGEGVGLGASPIVASGASASAGFSGEIFFDFEVAEETVAWLTAQGGNCNFVVTEFRIDPFLMNHAIWCSGDHAGFGRRYEETVWTGGTFEGPATETYDRYVGPAIGGVLHKSFAGEGARAVFREVAIRAFQTGVTYSDQAFLARLEGCTIGYCGTCIEFPPGATNAGENMRITNSVLFNSGLGLNLMGGGEWTIDGTSIDFCRLFLKAGNGARITFDKHMEGNPVEARLYLASFSGTFAAGNTVYGVSSGAIAAVLIVRQTDSRPHLVVALVSGTFEADEAISNSLLATAWLDGGLSGGEPAIDLSGGATLTAPHAGFLLSGAEHRGAQHFIRVADNLAQVALGSHWHYNFQTASGDLATGAGRVSFGQLLGPSNPQFPYAVIRNINADLFGGTGRIAGPGTAADMSRYPPADGIGFMFALHADSGTPTSRGVIPSVASVVADTGVAHTAGAGALKLVYDPAYSGGASLRVYVPVTPGAIVLDEYWLAKPDAVAAVPYGPYTTGSPGAGDTIKVSIAAGSQVATIEDKHVQWIGGNGPRAGWGVTLAGVAGNPGGIANAVWNAAHTVVDRTGDFTVTIDLGTPAPSSASGAGGGAVQSTWSATSFRFYERRFWVAVIGQDAYGRPLIGQDEYQGEAEFHVAFAAQDWVRRSGRNWGYTEISTPGDPMQRYGRGRAPDWATHFEMNFDWANVRFAAATPPPLYLADFFANRI